MKPKKHSFAAWRDAMGYSLSEAAEALGISRRHVVILIAGEQSGKTVEPTRVHRLAMAALAKGLAPWGEK